jgi:hypothetical protein
MNMQETQLDALAVNRIGYKPDPWAWTGWEWADGGRFNGRWDDANGNFRTLYCGSSLRACLFEVLACFRSDTYLVEQLEEIVVDDQDEILYPTLNPGLVPFAWLEPRTFAEAVLSGPFCSITESKTMAALRPSFVALALQFGLDDFDAAALKDARARPLTQAVSSFVYDTTDSVGIHFRSRHGDDLELWAIFERPEDTDVSVALSQMSFGPIDPEHEDMGL